MFKFTHEIFCCSKSFVLNGSQTLVIQLTANFFKDLFVANIFTRKNYVVHVNIFTCKTLCCLREYFHSLKLCSSREYFYP